MLDAASHIIRSGIAFEAFLFVYLVSATWIQNLNIYKSVCVCACVCVCVVCVCCVCVIVLILLDLLSELAPCRL